MEIFAGRVEKIFQLFKIMYYNYVKLKMKIMYIIFIKLKKNPPYYFFLTLTCVLISYCDVVKTKLIKKYLYSTQKIKEIVIANHRAKSESAER